MDTMSVGQRLVELCREGKNRQAIEELYADDAICYEAMDCPNGRTMQGKANLLQAADQFGEMFEVHRATVDGPYPNDDVFVCFMSLDVTGRDGTGPMAGKRMEMKEAAIYTVKEGKIIRSDFCYPPLPGG